MLRNSVTIKACTADAPSMLSPKERLFLRGKFPARLLKGSYPRVLRHRIMTKIDATVDDLSLLLTRPSSIAALRTWDEAHAARWYAYVRLLEFLVGFNKKDHQFYAGDTDGVSIVVSAALAAVSSYAENVERAAEGDAAAQDRLNGHQPTPAEATKLSTKYADLAEVLREFLTWLSEDRRGYGHIMSHAAVAAMGNGLPPSLTSGSIRYRRRRESGRKAP